MLRFLALILRKVFEYTVLLAVVTFATFLLSSFIPGDFLTIQQIDPTVSPEMIEHLRRQYHLDQPFHVQYARWLRGFLHLDLGQSLFYGSPVSSVVSSAAANSLWLGIPALIVAIPGGIFLGALHAVYRDRALGRTLDFVTTMALSLPSLVLGLGALLLASGTNWFPLGSMSSVAAGGSGTWEWLLDRLGHVTLPALCLAIPVLAAVERLQWSAARDSLDELYVRSARARGLGKFRILTHYIVRPSLNPIISASGPILGGVLSGSLVLEVIFSWPGLGQITYNALFSRDLFLLVGCVVGSSLLLIAGNVLADLLLLALDPRVRMSADGAGA
jgi:peptide/nickel transport system permease protein